MEPEGLLGVIGAPPVLLGGRKWLGVMVAGAGRGVMVGAEERMMTCGLCAGSHTKVSSPRSQHGSV